MTAIEKKQRLIKIIDNLPEGHLDELFFIVEDLSKKNENRTEFVKNLLLKEEALFKRLAE
ncbi:hypothetical protein [Cellulophaga sp. Hel_I_12]|uniref:hypothetical protein n=1 Tax=Cellulophaga sp. Hel_I_12 TaxID=1249972 RepID=UPI0006491E16|nr:hypothetical protein [Cellulophaga sp. Hel_I_12]